MDWSFATMRSLERPTEARREAFIEHLSVAHSWYKHLGPNTRGLFVVFLSAEGAASRQYPPAARAWGTLDYAWKTADRDAWWRDGEVEPVSPPESLVQVSGFTLGPCFSNDSAAIGVIRELWTSDGGAELAELARLYDQHEKTHDAAAQAALEAYYDALRAVETGLVRAAVARLLFTLDG